MTLRGRLSEADGGGRDPVLERVDGALVLTAANRQLEALVGEPRYRVGRVRDVLELRGVELSIPSGKADSVRRLIALARLGTEPRAPLVGPFMNEASELERAFVAEWLEEGEILLAWMATADERVVKSALGPEASVPAHLVWTDRRAALAAVHWLGDSATWPIEVRPRRQARRRGDRWSAAPSTWRMPRKGGARLRAIAPHLLADAVTRLRVVVDASRPPETPAQRARVLRLLERLAAEDPLAAFERALLEGGSLEGAPAVADRLGADAFVATVEAWGLAEARLAELQAYLRETDRESAAALALHQARRERALEHTRELEEQVRLDLEYVAHLVEAGREESALAVLRARLGRLAPLELHDLLPPAAAKESGGEREARTALLEARVEHGLEVTAALRELARMQPLDSGAHARLAAASGARAERSEAVLESGGLVPEATADGRAEPYDADDLQRVRHPLGRGPDVLAQIQSMVADIALPDTKVLRQYASGLRASDHPEAYAAYERASHVLGQRAEVFVSLGRRSIGARAYDVGDGLLVIGGDHLDVRSPRHLRDPAELRFLFGSELAHLRFGHRRATEDELWSGLRAKGMSTAELVLGLVPLLGRWKLGKRLGQVAGALKDGKLERAIELGQRFAERDDEPTPTDAHVAEGRMVAAHRLMQLSADRAGLLLAGDPVPAVRAMLRLSTDPSVAAFDPSGELASFLLERDEQGALVRELLAIRVGALLSFWLSDDYTELS